MIVEEEFEPFDTQWFEDHKTDIKLQAINDILKCRIQDHDGLHDSMMELYSQLMNMENLDVDDFNFTWNVTVSVRRNPNG